MISSQTFKSMLVKPSFADKNAEEWYGFVFDIRDNGDRLGVQRTNGGTSGVMTRHCGGYTWALLFNSWVKDLDLDGLVKYVSTRTAHVTCDATPNSLVPLPSRVVSLTRRREISIKEI